MKATPGPMTVRENRIPVGAREQAGLSLGKAPWGQRCLRVGPGSAAAASSTAHFPGRFLVSKSSSPCSLDSFPAWNSLWHSSDLS